MRRQSALLDILLGLLGIMVAAVVLWISLVEPGINGYSRAMFTDMVFGRAYKPYVYRVLVPAIIRAVQAVVPQTVRLNLVAAASEQTSVENLFTYLGWEIEYAIEYTLVVLILFVSLLAFIGAMRYLYAGLFDGSQFYGWLLGVLALIGIIPLLKYYNYIYDFPQLFLMTLSLGLMVRKQWPTYLVVLVFCSFNKETSILLIMVFIVYFWFYDSMERREFWRLMGIQAVIFLLVKGILTLLFMDNPGVFVEFHLYDYNLIRLRKIEPQQAAICVIGAGFLLFYEWRRKPAFLRVSLLMLLPLVGLTLFLGFIDEWRDYFEVYPVLVLLAGHSVGHLIGLRADDATGGSLRLNSSA